MGGGRSPNSPIFSNSSPFGRQTAGPPLGTLPPGPVWHASARALPGPIIFGGDVLERKARGALQGVGDAALGEWVDEGPTAVHVRRRLAPVEEARVGPVRDIRGTPEALRRMEKVRRFAPPGYPLEAL